MSSRSIFLLVCIVALISGAIFFLPTDEKKIKDNLSSLADYCSTNTNESVIESLTKATAASKLCTSPCRVEIQSRKINREFSQKEFSDNILILKKRLPNTSFHFDDVSIELLSKTQANAIATVRLNGRSNDGQFTDAYEVDIAIEKIEGDWLFSSFTVVEFMVK